MLSFKVSISGEELGSCLADDEEEAFYVFQSMSEGAHENFAKYVASHCATAGGAAEMAEFFQKLADAFKAAAES